MLTREIARELPLINLTDWGMPSTDVPPGALGFSCDIQQEQAADSPNPLMEVTRVKVQGFARMRHVRQSIDESVGLIIDFYLGGEHGTCTEPREGECVRCREAIDSYFSALEASYDETKPAPEEDKVIDGIIWAKGKQPVPFGEIFVRQPARLSWRDAFTKDGRFAPKAYGMSYGLDDAFLLVENAVREAGGEVLPAVDEARERLEAVVTEAVTEHGLTYEVAGTSWRDCDNHNDLDTDLRRRTEGCIARWSSEMLADGAGAGDEG